MNRLWMRAESSAARLTRPRTDLVLSDGECAQLLNQCSVARAWRWASAVTAPAWADSRLRSTLQPMIDDPRGLDRATSIRMVGWMVALAAVTALVLQQIEPTPPGPLTWLLPTAWVGIGIVVAAAATSIARKLRDRVS
jgi:hypothetical protein